MKIAPRAACRKPDEFGDLRLTTGARFVWRVVRDYSRKSGDCWLRQENLAAIVGKSDRQVRRYLGELEAAGLVEVERNRGPRSNLYRPKARTLVSGVRVDTDVHPRVDTDVRGKAAPSLYRIELDLNSNSRAAAADASPTIPQKREAADALRKLGIPRTLAEELAGRDPSLCLAALPYLTPRLTEPERFNLRNPAGFARSVLRNPEKHGFAKDEQGRWHAPDEEAPDERTSELILAGMNQRRREKEERERRLREEGERPSMKARAHG